MKIDETSLAIIKRLKDGRASYRKIAEELSITENTVRARVNKLREEGVLEISGIVNAEAIPGHTVILVGVKLNNMKLVEKGEEFSRLKGVTSVSVVTGQFDLIVQVLLNKDFTLLQFLSEEVSKIENVLSTETFVIYRGYNVKVPYIL